MSAFCRSNTIFSLPSSRSSVVAGAPLFCRPSSSTHDVGALQQLWPLAGWGSSPVTLRAYFLLLEPSNRTWMESIIDVDIAIDFVTGARDITKLSQNSRNRALSSLNRAASPSYLSFLPQIKSTPFELRHLSGLPLSPMVCKSEHRCHRQSVAVCDWPLLPCSSSWSLSSVLDLLRLVRGFLQESGKVGLRVDFAKVREFFCKMIRNRTI